MAKNRIYAKDIADYIDVDPKTIYNWKLNKPNLYRLVVLGIKYELAIAEIVELDSELPTDESIENPILKRLNKHKKATE